MTRLARHLVGAALDWPERCTRPRHDLGLHEPDDGRAIFLLAVRINRIVARIDDGSSLTVQAEAYDQYGEHERDDAERRLAIPGDRCSRFPLQCGAHRLLIPGCDRLGGREIEERGELRAIPYVRKHERRTATLL